MAATMTITSTVAERIFVVTLLICIIVVKNTKQNTRMPRAADKTAPDSIVAADSRRSGNAWEMNGFYHERINHFKLFAKWRNI
jgi:transposase